MCLRKVTRELHPEAAFLKSCGSKELGEGPESGAASALHDGVVGFRGLTSIDDDLATVIAAWAVLPEQTRDEILGLIVTSLSGCGTSP